MKFVCVKRLLFTLSLAIPFVSFAAEPLVHRNGVPGDASDSRATDWPCFRGAGAKGVADGHKLPEAWNADSEQGDVTGVLWRVEIPGLGHSSPVVVGSQVLIATAIAEEGEAPLQVGRGGRPDAADDNGIQSWVVLSYDKKTGKELWRSVAHRGVPRATRHAKATHANTSVAVHGDRVRLIFGVWHFEFSNIVSILGRAVINDRIEIGPARKLSVPVRDRRERGHDEKGTRSP